MVDYSNTDRLAVMQTEIYAIGNITEKTNALIASAEAAQALGEDISWHNQAQVLEKMARLRDSIPEIPAGEITYSPKAKPLDFVKQVLPYMQEVMGGTELTAFRNPITGSYDVVDSRGNLVSGNSGNNTEIVLSTGASVTTESFMKWWRYEKEQTPKLDEYMQVMYDKSRPPRPIMEDDAAATNDRDAAIERHFNNWVRKQKFANDLHAAYNNQFAIYEGKPAPLEVKSNPSPLFKPYPWQTRAATRFGRSGRLLLDHAVGAGKTFGALYSIGEAQARGQVKKAVYAVPKKVVNNWLRECKMIYPNAKTMVINSSNRRAAIAQLAVEHFDHVFISHEAFTVGMPLSGPRVREAVEAEMQPLYTLRDELMAQLAEASVPGARLEPGVTAATLRKSVKKIQDQIDKLRLSVEKIDAAYYGEAFNDTFDNIGVDGLVIDEFHNFKSLFTPVSEYGPIKGAGGSEDAVRAVHMLMAIRYMQQRNGGRNVLALTGTPVSNSATEIYNNLRALDPKLLEDSGIRTFTDFVNQVGKVEAEEVVKMDQSIAGEAVFTGIQNKNQLKRLNSSIIDRVGQEEMDKQLVAEGKVIPKPKYDDVSIPSNPVRRMMTYHQITLAALAEEFAKALKTVPGLAAQGKTLKREVEALKKSIQVLEKQGDSGERVAELKKELKATSDSARTHSLSILSLYGRIKGGMIDPRLFNTYLNESSYEKTKAKEVASRAAQHYLREGGEGSKIITITTKEGEKQFYEDADGKRHPVESGQIFFINTYQPFKATGSKFNAVREYQDGIIKAIRAKNPELTEEELRRQMLHLGGDVNAASKAVGDAAIEEMLRRHMKDPTDKEVEAARDAIKQRAGAIAEAEGDGDEEATTDVPLGKASVRDVAEYLYNAGHVRFLFGGSAIQEGMNLQYTTTAMHHIDMPFTPKDYIQRNGRGYRQGNHASEIGIYTYGVEGGAEVLILQLMRMKERMINDIGDPNTVDDFTQSNTIETGERDEASVLLAQLENIIKNTRDPRIREFLEMRKVAEALTARLESAQKKIATNRADILNRENRRSNIARFDALVSGTQVFQDELDKLIKDEKAGNFERKDDKFFVDLLHSVAELGDAMYNMVAPTILYSSKNILGEDSFPTRDAFRAGGGRVRLVQSEAGIADGPRENVVLYADVRTAIGKAIGRFKAANTDSLKKLEELEAKMNEQGYVDAVLEAERDLGYKEMPEGEKSVQQQIQEANERVRASQPIYEAFKAKQNRIAAYASYLVRDVLPGQTDAEARQTYDEFDKAVNEYEESDVPLPEFQDDFTDDDLGEDDGENGRGIIDILGGGMLMDAGGGGAGAASGSGGKKKRRSKNTPNPPPPRTIVGKPSYKTTGREIPVVVNGVQEGTSPAQISRNLLKNLKLRPGFNVRGGFRGARMLGKQTLGVFFANNGIIRLKYSMAAFETFAHEVGHMLDLTERLPLGDKLKSISGGLNMPLSKALSLTSDQEFRDMAEELLAFDADRINANAQYRRLDREGRLKEAIAEFVRQYIVDPDRAYVQANRFYEYFENITNDSEIDIALRTARNDFKEWADSSSLSQMMGLVNENTLGKGGLDWGLEMMNFVRKARMKINLVMFDMHWSLKHPDRAFLGKRIDDPDFVKARLATEYALNMLYGMGDSINAFALKPFRRVVNYATGEINITSHGARGLLDIIEPFYKAGHFNEVNAYLLAHRMLVYFERGLLTDQGQKLTDDHKFIKTAKGTIAEFDAKFAAKPGAAYGSTEEAEAAQKLSERAATLRTDINDYQTALLDLMADAGILTRDEVVAMKAMNPFYVPLKISTYEDFAPEMKGDGVQLSVSLDSKKPLKAIRTLDIKNLDMVTPPIEAIMENTHRIFSAVNQNQISWAAVHMLHQMRDSLWGDAKSDIIQKVPEIQDLVTDKDGEPIRDPRTGFFMMKNPKDKGMVVIAVRHRHAYNRGGVFVQGGGTKSTELDDLPIYNDDLPTPGVFSRPKVQYYQVPAEVYKSLAPQKALQWVFDSKLGSIASGTANVLRYSAVVAAVPFYFRNIHRDLFTSMYSTRNGMDVMTWGKELLANTGDALHVWHKEDLLDLAGISHRVGGGQIAVTEEWLLMAAGAGLTSSILQGDNSSFGVGLSRKEQGRKNLALLRKLKAGQRGRLRQTVGRFSPFSLSNRGLNDDFLIARITAASERTTRGAAARTALIRTGGNLAEAAHAYRNASGDWAVGGTVTSGLAPLIPFIKAEFLAIKGLAKAMREAKDQDTPDRRKHLMLAFATAIGWQVARTLLEVYGYPDEDDEIRKRRQIAFLQRPAWRNGYVSYPLPGGREITFPASQLEMNLNVMTDALMRQAMYAHDKELKKYHTPAAGDDVAKQWFNSFTGRTVPLKFSSETGNVKFDLYSYVPQLVSPIFQFGANYDAFRNRPIESPLMKYRPVERRAYLHTPHAYRLLSKWAVENNIPVLETLSPIQMDWLVNSYFATVGRQTGDIASWLMVGEVDDYGTTIGEALNPLENLQAYETIGSRGTATARTNEILDGYQKWSQRFGDAFEAVEAMEEAYGIDSEQYRQAEANLAKLKDTKYFKLLTGSPPLNRDGTPNKTYKYGIKSDKVLKDIKERTRDYRDYMIKRQTGQDAPSEDVIMLEVTEFLVDFINAYDEDDLEYFEKIAENPDK